METTPTRKLREIRTALALDKVLTKPEILTRYLNLVSFGNGAYGIQDAARTYFGIDAAQLNWQQSALLAGMVQSTSALNPYTNPQGALDRRNLVLDTMIENLPEHADALRAAREQPLGVLPQPNMLPQGCIAAGDRAFFCDYALEYLARAGISKADVARNGYLIKTTLDPKVQNSVKKAINTVAAPTLDSVASVMSVIRPGKDAHRVLAMGDNRAYGLKLEAGQTVQPQPFTLVGDGAGSIFKIFTSAAALDMGMGINAMLDVPPTFQGTGLGDSDTKGCPPRTWCVKNAAGYRSPMSMTDALALSPNTAFAKLIQQVGVPRAVDMAVRLGLRSYADPGTARAYVPNEQREPRRLHQTGEHRLIHPRAVRGQCPWSCRMSRPRWPPAACGARRLPSRGAWIDAARRSMCRRPSASRWSRGVGQHADQCAGQRHHDGYRRCGGRFGRLGSADGGKDRHHRIPPVLRRSSATPTNWRRPATCSTTPRNLLRCAPSRCASAAVAEISTAEHHRPKPGSWR